jgi:RNA polymerase sigma-70 factor (ECF subfamily)
MRCDGELALDGLLERVRRGEESALRDLIREFSPLVYGMALSITHSEADAEDVLQEVFIGLPEALRRFDGRNFAGWLRVVSRRRALMAIRSRNRRASHADRARSRAGGYVEDQTLNRIAIERALASLPATLRSVFLMKEVQGLSHREIGEALGITVALSQIRLHRARNALQRILA